MNTKTHIIAVAIFIFLIFGRFYYNSDFSSTNILLNQNEPSRQYEYLDMSPDVKYVGGETCSTCHLEIFRSYKNPGMGTSFYKPTAGNVIESFKSNNSVHDEISNFHYEVIQGGGEFFQREYRLDEDGNQIYELKRKIDWIIGSGRQARTYMTMVNGLIPITRRRYLISVRFLFPREMMKGR